MSWESIVAFKEINHRSEEYLQFIREQACLVCGTSPCDPHHLNFKGNQSGGMGLKTSDYRTIPLCRIHHNEYHNVGKITFADRHSLDLKMEIIKHIERYMTRGDDEGASQAH
jgi:hypothetical protein